MNDRFDAVVVGAGLGGLTCAAYLAAAGMRVVVLEQHDWAGGNSHVFRRRRSYEFDVGVHYIGDCGPDGIVPAVLRGAGAGDRVRFRALDQDRFDRVVLPGLVLDVPADWAGYLARLEAAFPGERAGLRAFTGVCRAVAEEQRRALLAPPGTSPADLVAGTHATRAWGRKPVSELFDHCGLSTRARTVLAAQSPNYGLGPADATVSTHAVVTDHYIRGAYVPVGGGQVLAATLVEVLEAAGGELRTRCRVTGIDVADRAVTGVRLADGTRIDAPVVVSNADYRRTVLELVGPEHFSKRVVRNTLEASSGLPFATLYVALDRPLADHPRGNTWWYADDDIEGLYAGLLRGEQPDDVRFLFISPASAKDPLAGHLCPPGHANLQLMTMCPPGYRHWGVAGGPADGVRYRRDPAYLAEKRRFTEAVLHAGERVLGPLREHVTHLELATPLTQERYTLSTGGTPFGLARWGSAGSRPDTATAVKGLHVVGQSTRYGSGITGVMVGGTACAGQIVGRPLLSEVYRGTLVGDPSSLPDRSDDWDPLAVSRGSARVGARVPARTGSAGRAAGR